MVRNQRKSASASVKKIRNYDEDCPKLKEKVARRKRQENKIMFLAIQMSHLFM